jgi:hypothetical protein
VILAFHDVGVRPPAESARTPGCASAPPPHPNAETASLRNISLGLGLVPVTVIVLAERLTITLTNGAFDPCLARYRYGRGVSTWRLGTSSPATPVGSFASTSPACPCGTSDCRPVPEPPGPASRPVGDPWG